VGRYKVELLPAAWDDLQEIFDYIFLDSPQSAEDTVAKVLSSLRHLEEFPNTGAYPPDMELKKRGFRMAISAPYISFYRLFNDTVYVYHIVHGARNYPNLFDVYF
jgi:toxin ParE1/3/4